MTAPCPVGESQANLILDTRCANMARRCDVPKTCSSVLGHMNVQGAELLVWAGNDLGPSGHCIFRFGAHLWAGGLSSQWHAETFKPVTPCVLLKILLIATELSFHAIIHLITIVCKISWPGSSSLPLFISHSFLKKWSRSLSLDFTCTNGLIPLKVPSVCQVGAGLPVAVSLVAIGMGLNLLEALPLRLPSLDVDVRQLAAPPLLQVNAGLSCVCKVVKAALQCGSMPCCRLRALSCLVQVLSATSSGIPTLTLTLTPR